MYTIAVLLKFPDFPVTMMAAELSASTMQKLEACFSPFRRRQYRIGINQRRGVSSSTLRVLILRYNITFRLILVGYVIYHHDIITYQSQSIPPCISLSIYIKYKYVCVYIYICIHTPINYIFFDSLIFQNTRLLPSKICSPRAQSGPPSKRVPTETRHHVQRKGAAVVGQSNIDVEHRHELPSGYLT